MPREALSHEQLTTFRTKAVEAAEQLFAKGGIEGVTMRALAEALGCSAMTPYRYFGDREDLVLSLRASAFARFADAQRDALLGAGTRTPSAQLQVLQQTYIDFALENPNAYRLMFALEPATRRHADHEREAHRAFSFVLEVVKEAVHQEGIDAEPSVAAHLFWGQLHGLVSLHLSGKLIFGCSLEELRRVPVWKGVSWSVMESSPLVPKKPRKTRGK